MTASTPSLIGFWYAVGPADRAFDPADPAFAVHRIVADDHALPGCVTVRNPAGQTFPLSRASACEIAVPPPVAADNPHLRRRGRPQTGDRSMTQNAPPPPRTRWPWTPVPREVEGRAVLGAFRDPPDHGDWTVLCDATDADDAFLIGRWRPEEPYSLAAVTRHTSAFKAILAFETARLAALQKDAR